MTDRPIIFSAPMIQALLAKRKTRTRRVLRLPKWASTDPGHIEFADTGEAEIICRDTGCLAALPLPYAVGDRLWVRETCRAEELESGQDGVRYAADKAFAPIQDARWAADMWLALRGYRQKTCRRGSIGLPVPSIHMPRWASRLTLPVVSVRVERLLDITEEDAEAEGVCHFVEQGHRAGSFEGLSGAERTARVCNIYGSCREAFRALWESLHGPASWNANPWVVPVGFDVQHANIDALDAGRAAA